MNRIVAGSILAAAFGATATLWGPAAAAQCSKQSPPHTVALIELYTSEGCSSCPPADRWLSGIERSDARTDSVIALALHVDYWDQLGWKDRFADHRFTERQRALAAMAQNRFVYTPGVFLNLREWRGWGSAANFRQAVAKVNARPALADIRLELGAAAPRELALSASFKLKPGAVVKQPQAFVALYQNGLATEVRAGENRGATLRHDYVVRNWNGPIDLRSGSADLRIALPIGSDSGSGKLGVAAFVQDSASGELLQATALNACS